MTNVQIRMNLYQTSMSSPETVIHIMQVLETHGVRFWTPDQQQPLSSNAWKAKVVQEIQRCLEKWEHIKQTRPDLLGQWPKWDLSFSLQLDKVPELRPYFSIFQFNDHLNKLEIGELVEFELKDQRPYLEPLAQALLDLGRLLYPLIQLDYGYIDESSANPILFKEVPRRRLRHISWVNFFGPSYVEKYGRDFLLGLPGYRTEPLPDGGVFHQLSPTFVAQSRQQARQLRRAVLDYCARHGLKVTCRAPYVVPGLTPSSAPKEPTIPDDQLHAYLRQILATTLVLKDGTRLKHLYIPWEDLTEAQRETAVLAIRRMAEEELFALMEGKGQRLRLEFNEIPEELDRTLRDLFGPDNPQVEWVEVPMPEENPPGPDPASSQG